MTTNVRTVVTHNGKDYTGQIATIKSAFFGKAYHDIISTSLVFEWPHGSVSVGGYCLDTPVFDEQENFVRREGTAWGLTFLMATMETIGVEGWNDLVGEKALVLFDGPNAWGSESVGFASLDGERVLITKEHLEQWKADHPTEK